MDAVTVAPKRRRAAATAPKRLGRGGVLLPVLSVVLALVLWELSTNWLKTTVLIPSFSQVILRGVELLVTAEIFVHVGASLSRILLGFLIGSLIGGPAGLLMGSVKTARNLLDPYIQFFRFVPSIAWLTPAVIWFGIGEVSKVAIIVYTTVFIVTINTVVGVSNVSKQKVWAALSLGATGSKVFLHVTLPATLPFILTGMRLAMGNSFATVVAAEMVASDQGLGFLIFNSRLWMATDTIFLAILALGFLGFATDLLFRRLIRRFARQFGPVE